MTSEASEARIRAEVREIEKAAALLACIQCTAEYDNEVEADLADAVSVVRDIVARVAARLAAALPIETVAGDERPV